jgi:hypothetical protein
MALFLRANNDDLRVITGEAGDIEPHISAMVADTAGPPVLKAIPDFGPGASITTATTTTIIDSSTISGISSGDTVNVKEVSLKNNHASQNVNVTVDVTDGTNTTELAQANLLPGETLLYDGDRWIHYDTNMAEYPAIGNAATQAEMEAGTATDRYVTPQGFNWHPGATKAWGKANGAGTSLIVNWNVSGISDTGTGRLGVTIGTDFSTANYSISTDIERSATALTATGVEQSAIRNASPAVGSLEIESFDHTAILFAAQDPANYYWQCCGDQ